MATDMTVAETILQQMGGSRRLKVMIGASNFGGTEDSLQFDFKGSRKYNKCRITLDFGMDLYKLELFQFRRKSMTCPLLYECEGLYFDQLIGTFEEETGLHLSLGTMGR